MKTGLKFRCYPNPEQQQLIHQTSSSCRFVYNHFLNLKNTWWNDNQHLPKEQRSKPLSGMDCIKLLPNLKKTIYSLDKQKINAYEENLNKNNQTNHPQTIDFITISGQDFESLKIYWLKDSLSTPLQQTLLDLGGAYQDFFKGKKKYPQFKKKSSSGSFTLTSNNWSFKYHLNNQINDKNLKDYQKQSQYKDLKLNFSNADFYLAKCDKPLKIAFDKRIEQDIDLNKISQLTISYDGSGEYFISFLINEDVKDFKQKNIIKNHDNYLKHSNNQGNHTPIVTSIDLGIKATLNILTTTENSQTHHPIDRVLSTRKLMGLKRHDKRLCRAQKSLFRKKKGSKNYFKQCQKVARVHKDLTNYRNDFYHKASTEIVLNSDKIIIEDLNISGMMKNKKLAKSIHQQAWGTFFTMLKYKCGWYGKELIEVNRFFPSSKLCSHCHTYNQHVQQQDIWTCTSCGIKHQRDENAVVNLYDYNEYQKQGKSYVYVGNQLVNNPIIKKNLHENQVRKLNDIKNQILLSRQEDFVKSKACGENVRPECPQDTQANLNEARKSYNLTHNTM